MSDYTLIVCATVSLVARWHLIVIVVDTSQRMNAGISEVVTQQWTTPQRRDKTPIEKNSIENGSAVPMWAVSFEDSRKSIAKAPCKG